MGQGEGKALVPCIYNFSSPSLRQDRNEDVATWRGGTCSRGSSRATAEVAGNSLRGHVTLLIDDACMYIENESDFACASDSRLVVDVSVFYRESSS